MTELILQPDDTTGKDTQILQEAATTNYVNSTGISLGKQSAGTNQKRYGLLAFDLSTLAGAIVSSAVLSLYVDSEWLDNPATLRIYRLKRNWVEDQATYNIFSTGNNWGTAGALDATNDYDSSVDWIGGVSISASVSGNQDFTLNNTEFQKLVNGTYTNYGWKLDLDVGGSTNDGINIRSSSHATANTRPKLTVQYLANRSLMKVCFIG